MLKYFKQTNGLACISIIFEGSNLEEPGEFGAAHLLEHLVCRKISKLENDFELNGIESNAGTSPNYTIYYIRGLDEKVKKFAQEFYDLISYNPLDITEQQFEEEKRIIIQEWHDDVINPDMNLMNRFYVRYYKNPRTIGELRSLENLSFFSFKQMYEKNFSKPLYCLIENSSNWKIKDWVEYKRTHDSPLSMGSFNKVKQFPNRPSSNPSLLLISDSFMDQFTEHHIINEMIGEGMNSPLFKKLREDNQLVYSILNTLDFPTPYICHSKFMTSTQRENKDKVWKLFKDVLNDKKWLNEKRFHQCIERSRIECEIEKRLNQLSPAQDFLHPHEMSIEKGIKTLTYKYVKTVANFYTPKNFILFE